jgi:hypothetical protein
MHLLPWDEEAHAMAVVTHFLGGRSVAVDPGGGARQLHDFDQVLDSGGVVAIEITRANDPRDLQFAREVSKNDWQSDALCQTWVVDVRGTPNVRTLRERVIPLLASLEAAAVASAHLRHEMFDDPRYLPRFSAEQRRILEEAGALQSGEELCGLGVCLVYSLGPSVPGGVIIGKGPIASSTAPSVVTNIASRQACLPDNAAKLAAADDRDARHLFVWVESSLPSAVAAFAFDDGLDPAALPIDPPVMPEHVDAVWLVTAFEPARVWRFQRTTGWESLGNFRTDPPEA